jgi:hypothetical protein
VRQESGTADERETHTHINTNHTYLEFSTLLATRSTFPAAHMSPLVASKKID